MKRAVAFRPMSTDCPRTFSGAIYLGVIMTTPSSDGASFWDSGKIPMGCSMPSHWTTHLPAHPAAIQRFLRIAAAVFRSLHLTVVPLEIRIARSSILVLDPLPVGQ